MAKYDAEKFDSCLNTFREIYSNPVIDKYQGTVILPLDFSLEMDGISGIIPNSAFEIPVDSLPKGYITKKGKSKIAFILHTIDHNFGGNKWTTKMTGQTLNIRFDELTAAQKKEIEDFKLPTLLNKKARKIGSNGPKDKLNAPDPPIKVTKAMTSFAEVVKAVVVNLEGGYYNGGGNGDARYSTSGETMFGIDRKQGGKLNSSPAGIKFWKIMDDNNAKTKWPWLYIPKDPIKSELYKLVAEMMKPTYDSYSKRNFDKEVKTLVESDGRLYYNMVYAAWNGPGWFEGFAKVLNNAYKAGSKTSDQLLAVITKERLNGGVNAYKLGTGDNLGPNGKSLIAQTAVKIAKATGVAV
jgi:hypothetical protein